MSMLEHDMWNPFGRIRWTPSTTRVTACPSIVEARAAGGKRQSRVSGNSAFDAVGGSFVAYLAPRFGPSSSSRPARSSCARSPKSSTAPRRATSAAAVPSRSDPPASSSTIATTSPVLFVGELENNAEPPRTSRTEPRAPHHLRRAHPPPLPGLRPRLRSELIGFFSFVVVDGRRRRRARRRRPPASTSFPLAKGRTRAAAASSSRTPPIQRRQGVRHNTGEADARPRV